MTTGKRQREVGLVVPAKLIFITNNKRFLGDLENKLVKQKNTFPTVTLKFKKKGVCRKFPFCLIKYRKTQLMLCFFLTGVQQAYCSLSRINALLEAGRLLEGVFIEKNHKKRSVYSKHCGSSVGFLPIMGAM